PFSCRFYFRHSNNNIFYISSYFNSNYNYNNDNSINIIEIKREPVYSALFLNLFGVFFLTKSEKVFNNSSVSSMFKCSHSKYFSNKAPFCISLVVLSFLFLFVFLYFFL